MAAKPTVAELVARIETLEHRVAMLEQEKSAKPSKPAGTLAFTGNFADASAFAKTTLARRPRIDRKAGTDEFNVTLMS